MNHDMVWWAVMICVGGSIVVLFGLFFMLARQAKKTAEEKGNK
jgi:hypothetical protein